MRFDPGMSASRVRGALLTGLGFVVAVGVGFWIGSMVGERPPQASTTPAEVVRDARDQLLAVFLGSVTCQVSRGPQVAADWRAAVTALREYASSNDLRLRTLGIGVSDRPGRGAGFLAGIGQMDEINVGGGWTSLGVTRYVSGNGEHPGPGFTPQVLVLRRTSSPSGVGFDGDSLLVRAVGRDEIGLWVEAGAPLDWRVPGENQRDVASSATGR